ncbi:MAG: DJ-1/PfpI family protein [Ruminococcaceae bacterium]|nr:DJ-1/PfpI family protein [Oscillospiraceae bacterium]
MVYIFLAEGFEECEALVPLDILRRADIKVKTVGIGAKVIEGSHKIKIECDLIDTEATTENLEAVILPGGMPGTINLEKSETVQNFIDFADKEKLLLAAICAAPSILGHKNLLVGKKATCFCGFEKELLGAVVSQEKVEVCENIVTAYGAGAAFEFGFAILEKLKSKECAELLKKQMRYI